MKKVLLFSAALFVIALGMGVSASAETKKIGNFKYEYDSAPNGNDVWITQITPVTGSDISTLKIPSKIDGNKVIKLGAKDDTDAYFQDNIFGMYILEEDSSLVPEQIVSDVAKIKKIILPSGLKELTPECFHDIQKGKTFYGNLEKKKSIKIPNGVKTIAEGALFLNDNLKVVYIPKTVSKIKEKAFGTSKSLRIKIASKNQYYYVSKGCVVSRRSGRLVVAGIKKGVITIPEKVTVLKEGTSFVGGKCEKIVFPKSLKQIEEHWAGTLGNSSKIEYIFQSKEPPKRKGAAFLLLGGSVVYVPKGTKQVYEKAMKKFSYDLKIVEK